MEETTNYGLKLIEDTDDYTDIFDDHNDSMEIIDTELAKKLESVPVMTGATSLTDGTEGLAPKPLAGETNRFLRADGTWTVPAGSGDSQVGIYTIDATIPVSSWVAGTGSYSVTISDQTIISTMTVIEWGITNETEANPLMLGETNVTVGAGTLTITTTVIPVASWTVHIDLGTDGSNVLNEVVGKADQELLGYREDGNTASRTIASGSYVVWKGGLYKASTSIPQGTAFSSSNLTAVTSGGFNELQSSVTSLSDRIATGIVRLGSAVSLSSGNIELTFNVEKTGYRPVGILAYNLFNRGIANKIFFSGMIIDGNSAIFYGQVSENITIDANANVSILYIKL